MSQKTREFKITVPALEGVSAREWKEYITDAVGSWKGQFHPDEPLFDLDSDEVKCVSLYSKRQPDSAVHHLATLKEIQAALSAGGPGEFDSEAPAKIAEILHKAGFEVRGYVSAEIEP